MAVKGAKAHVARLKRISSPAQVARVGRALFKAGKAIESEAKHLITEGSVSGKKHVASLPGEPPNRDTGHLDSNIETTQPEPVRVLVSSIAKYAAELEFGTSHVSPRPYMKPAADRKRKEVTDYVRAAVKKTIEEG